MTRVVKEKLMVLGQRELPRETGQKDIAMWIAGRAKAQEMKLSNLRTPTRLLGQGGWDQGKQRGQCRGQLRAGASRLFLKRARL